MNHKFSSVDFLLYFLQLGVTQKRKIRKRNGLYITLQLCVKKKMMTNLMRKKINRHSIQVMKSWPSMQNTQPSWASSISSSLTKQTLDESSGSSQLFSWPFLVSTGA